MAVGVWLTAIAGNTIALTSTQGHPGDEVEVAVVLSNDSEITALELLIPLDDALHYVDGSAVMNAERVGGHQLVAAVRDGKLSIVVFSSSLAPLQGTEGEVCSFKLKLGKEPANYTLTPQVVVSDANGKAIQCGVESGIVTLLSPKIEVTTSTVDYGRVPIRSSYTKTMTIRNSGNEPLEITTITFDNTDLSVSSVPCTIAVGSTRSFTLTYAPLQRGMVTSNVTITSNAINPKAGKAVVKAQPFSVNELHVQRAEGVSDEEVTIVLKMKNMEPIAGAQCEFTLPDALKYVEGSAAVGSRCVGTDHVAAGFAQGQKLTLLLYSASNKTLPEGDGELMTFRVRLDGKSGSYRLAPQEVVLSNATVENMTSATSGNYVVINSPTFSGSNTLDMGSVAVTNKATATYSIYNSGKVDLVIDKVTFLAEGYVVEEELPLVIAPRQTKGLKVAYTPTKEGAHKTTMQIYTNDPTNRMHSVTVSGEVYEPNRIVVSGDNTREGYQFAFGLDNYTDIVAIQMNVRWISGMSTSTAALKITERLKNHSCLVTDMGGGNYQVLVFSMANTPISGNSGDLFTLDYTAVEGITYQDTELRVTDIVLSDARGNNYVSSSEASARAVFSNFTLRFVVDGETISEEFIKNGSKIVAPEVANRVGYSFAWTGLQETMPSGDLTVTGSYMVNNYNVVYLVDGEEYRRVSIPYGTELTALAAPTKEGHTFSGWSEIPETMPAGDVTISGNFTINSYTLTYMVDGEAYKTESIVYGTVLTTIAMPTKDGYTFSGWSEIPETMPAGDVTITGNFTINSYTLTYTVDGEDYKTETIVYGTVLTAIAMPTKEGYTFSGWSEIPETMPAGDVTISGNFTINSYTLTYTVDGEAYKIETIVYGTVLTAIAMPTKEGYTFSGWSEIPETMPAGDVTVSGNFTINSYTLTYTVDGEAYKTETVVYGTALTALAAPTKDGYTFSGWSEIPETMPAGDVVISGIFLINKYLITFRIDDDIIASDSLEYGAVIVVPEAPEREGYTFSGWSEIPATMPAENMTISGTFIINKYVVTFMIGDEVIASDSLEYGSAIVVPEAPEKEGYAFDGWGVVAETVPASDVVYEGSYTINTYTVYYYVGDEMVNTVAVSYGDAMPVYVYEPTGEGDVFNGWIGETYDTMPAHDVVYVANITNGILKLTDNKSQMVIYGLSGRKVTDTDNLRGGVYIIDGRKVVVK